MTKNFSYLLWCALLAGTFLSNGVFAGDSKDGQEEMRNGFARQSVDDEQGQGGSGGAAGGSNSQSSPSREEEQIKDLIGKGLNFLLTGRKDREAEKQFKRLFIQRASAASTSESAKAVWDSFSDDRSALKGAAVSAAQDLLPPAVLEQLGGIPERAATSTPAPAPILGTGTVLGGATATTPSTSSTAPSDTSELIALRLARLARFSGTTVAPVSAAATTSTAGTAIPDAPQPIVYSLEVPAPENAKTLKVLENARETLWSTGSNAASASAVTTAPMSLDHLTEDERLQLVTDTPGLSSPEADSSGAAAASLSVEGLSYEDQLTLAIKLSLE